MSSANQAPLFHQKKHVPKEFDNVARRYDLATTMSQGYQADLDRSAAALALKGHENVLDLCCGTGRSTAACLPFIQDGTITGIDNSEGMLEEARRKFKLEIEKGKLDFHQMDAMHLDLPSQTYDAVFAAYGLRNMPDYDEFIQGVHRVLKPGGKIGIHDYSLAPSTWVKWYWAILGYGFIIPFCTLMTGHSSIFRYLIKSVREFLNPEEIVALLQRNGFHDVKVVRHPSWRKPLLHTFIAIRS
jgi:ubiquinone/menaquinone biosynthesis methyltransferase